MGLSAGNSSSGPFGLQLRAWGLFNGATGALISGSGVTSTSRASVGSYSFVLTSAVTAQAVVVCRASTDNSSGIPYPAVKGGMTSTTNGDIQSIRETSGAGIDSKSIHFEVWQ